MDEIIPPDTQAVLLLCGIFAREGGTDDKPLTTREYNALAAWLRRERKSPADLLKNADEPIPPDEPDLPDRDRVRGLLARGMQMATALERWQRLGLWVVSRDEERYPDRLRQNLGSAAPALLYGAGDVNQLALGGMAVVGSREIDEEGLDFTRRVAERLAGAGMQVISGGARGVDQAAMSAALQAGGSALAVLPDRLDRAATSREAKEWIRDGKLAMITPFDPESAFTVGKAMGRNRLIYTLADRALIVRFTKGEGGTWAGAVEQLRQNQPLGPSVPVYVRVANNPDDGWRELRGKGALPFPEEEFWEGDVRELMNG